jgi:hypothetical protein
MLRARLITTLVVGVLCIAGCGAKSSTATSRTVSVPPVKVSIATALRWPKVFCALKPGVSQPRIIQLMGPQTSTGTDAAGAPVVEWAALGYEFYADFDKSGATSTMFEVLPNLEASQDPRMTSRLHGCPWLSSG